LPRAVVTPWPLAAHGNEEKGSAESHTVAAAAGRRAHGGGSLSRMVCGRVSLEA
jgi:hypothetical protein